MKTWYVPSWNGDFRLEPRGDDECQITVVDPTPVELETLKAFMAQARRNGWSKQTRLPSTPGNPILLKAKLTEAAPLLVQLANDTASQITAVKFAGGQVEVTSGKTAAAEAAAKIEESEGNPEAEQPEAAASVKRPTPCCPNCVPGSVLPATEVLLTFLTPEQHEDWSRHRWIEVVGGMSGHRYVLAHRHTELARRWKRICLDKDDGFVLHFHDWSVPPEEEVLATMLILQHRENWLRNEATCFYARNASDVFKNPFGDVTDGRVDAVILDGFGTGLLAAMGAK